MVRAALCGGVFVLQHTIAPAYARVSVHCRVCFCWLSLHQPLLASSRHSLHERRCVDSVVCMYVCVCVRLFVPPVHTAGVSCVHGPGGRRPGLRAAFGDQLLHRVSFRRNHRRLGPGNAPRNYSLRAETPRGRVMAYSLVGREQLQPAGEKPRCGEAATTLVGHVRFFAKQRVVAERACARP